jgi:uncharacterized protein (DUF433 family)
MNNRAKYKYLKPKRGSRYRQLFVDGRIMAEILYRRTVGAEPKLPQEVAEDYGIPVEAVFEAIDYAQRNPEVLAEDRAMEDASIQAHGLDQWPHAPKHPPVHQ